MYLIAVTCLVIFVFQVDAYLYSLGISAIRPWILVSGCAAVFFSKTLLKIISLPRDRVYITRDMLVFACVVLFYITTELALIFSWRDSPQSLTPQFFWMYSVLLVLLGVAIGNELSDSFARICAILIVLFLVLVFVAMFVVLPNFSGVRAETTLRNPNGAAFVLVLLSICALRWRDDPGSVWNLLPILCAAVGIAFTGSRGGSLAFLVVMSMFGYRWVSHSKSELGINSRATVIVVSGAFAIVISLSALVYFRYGLSLFSPELFRVIEDFSANERLRAAAIAAALYEDSPLVGHGTGYVYGMTLGPHNMYLRALVEGGLLGLFAYCSLIIAGYWLAYRRRDWRLSSFMTAIVVMGLTTHNLTEDRSLLLLFGALLADAGRKRVLSNRKSPLACN